MRFYFIAAIFLWLGDRAWAGTATDITGLYYSGTNNTGGLLAGGATDSHWTVTYARVYDTNYTGNSTYTGAAYVINPTLIAPSHVANSSNAQWITAPGASTAVTGGTIDTGGDYLPGNGTSGRNSATYVYRLAFTVVGTGTGTATNSIAINLTLAADDQYSVYVNPTLNRYGGVDTASTLGGAGTTAWTNTTSLYLQNITDANGAANASFVIGTNYIYVVVTNTRSITGSSSSTDLNPSGLLVYQLNGRVIPEVGAILPVLGALGLFGWRHFRRRPPTAV